MMGLISSFVSGYLRRGVDRTVLCLHGMNSHSGYFARLGSSLAEKGSAVYALDLRGNGLSGMPGDAENSHRQIADVGFVLKQLRSAHSGKPVYLLGHSLGAGYALRFAFLHPEALDGLILLAPAVRTISAPSFRLILTMATMGFRILLPPPPCALGHNDWVVKGSSGKRIGAENP